MANSSRGTYDFQHQRPSLKSTNNTLTRCILRQRIKRRSKWRLTTQSSHRRNSRITHICKIQSQYKDGKVPHFALPSRRSTIARGNIYWWVEPKLLITKGLESGLLASDRSNLKERYGKEQNRWCQSSVQFGQQSKKDIIYIYHYGKSLSTKCSW